MLEIGEHFISFTISCRPVNYFTFASQTSNQRVMLRKLVIDQRFFAIIGSF